MSFPDKGHYVFIQPGCRRKAGLQFSNDLVDRAPAIDPLQHLGGAAIELDHPLGIEQHMAVLHRFPLHAITRPERRYGCQWRNAHNLIPRCQAGWSVTVWYGARSSS